MTAVEPRPDARPGSQIVAQTTDARRSDAFDTVVIATGLYNETPHIPAIPSGEAFRGCVLHVSELKTHPTGG